MRDRGGPAPKHDESSASGRERGCEFESTARGSARSIVQPSSSLPYDFDQTQSKSWPRLNFYGRRREANCRFFGLLIITEVIADTRRSSKSRLTPADLGASRLREPDCACEVLLAISDHLSLSAVSRRTFEVPELRHSDQVPSTQVPST